MIKLSEKDVKAVARSRLLARFQWWIVGFLVLLVVAMFVSATLTDFVWAPVITVVVLFITGIIWFYKLQNKWERKLVDEWKSSSTS